MNLESLIAKAVSEAVAAAVSAHAESEATPKPSRGTSARKPKQNAPKSAARKPKPKNTTREFTIREEWRGEVPSGRMLWSLTNYCRTAKVNAQTRNRLMALDKYDAAVAIGAIKRGEKP